jgi:hypothetical protein
VWLAKEGNETMPTRKDKAFDLINKLRNGPSLNLHVFGAPDIAAKLTPEENEAIQQKVRLWLSSWIEPLVIELVPELKELRQ